MVKNFGIFQNSKMLQRLSAASLILRALKILSPKDQRKILFITLLQVLMGGLDLLGVAAVGLLGALSVAGLQSGVPGNRVLTALEFMHIESATFQTQVAILGTSAVFLLIGRTVLSIIFTRRIIFFLSRRGAQISASLISRLLSQPLLVVQSRSSQETVYAITYGVERIVLQVLANVVVWVSDATLLLVMIIGLLVVDPMTAIATLVIFLFVAYLLYRFMHSRIGDLGEKNSILNIESNEKIVEVIASYRESVVRNRRDYYAREIGQLRYDLANTSAEIAFFPYIGKYVIETTVIVGAILIGVAQFILQDADLAIANLAIFLAAGTRIAPAILRLQQGSISIRSGLGAAIPTLGLIDELGNAAFVENVDDKVKIEHIGFVPEIVIKSVSFTYPNRPIPAISNITFTIPKGSSVAFVGPSGAGKTTLIDIILGVLNPNTGTVSISGISPLSAVAKWPGAISYVPQDVIIVAGSIRENIALGYPVTEATDELISGALRVSHLEEFVSRLPEGVDTHVGERGARISGGQRQRLGIARAMFTQPKLLVLDEATSSLDGESEASISEAIQALRGRTTVVVIAHRLSTVRNVDIVVYIADGKVLTIGTFEEVRGKVPDFDRQARRMGL